MLDGSNGALDGTQFVNVEREREREHRKQLSDGSKLGSITETYGGGTTVLLVDVDAQGSESNVRTFAKRLYNKNPKIADFLNAYEVMELFLGK